MNKLSCCVAVAVAGVAMRSTSTSAQCEPVKLLSSDGATAQKHFGESVSIYGDIVIVGAHGGTAPLTGAAYIFERNQGGPDNWGEAAKLLASDGENQDWFGYRVSVSGNIAIIGAYADAVASVVQGSAYVFRRDLGGNWAQEAKLLAADGGAGDWFGISVANSGDLAVIGASKDDDLRGSAYVFRREVNGIWVQEAKLTADDGVTDESFGYSVSIDGLSAVVGAHNNMTRGAAYIFQRSKAGNWSQEAKLVASDGASFDAFGYSVAISGEFALIGALGDGAGSAYVFGHDAGVWTEGAKFTPVNPNGQVRFGGSVGMSGALAVVGAMLDNDNGIESGSAYRYRRDAGGTWTAIPKLIAPDGEPQEMFGGSVSASDGLAVIGAHRDDDNGHESGSAYIFVLNDCDCNGIPDNQDIANGTSFDCNGNGLPDECDIAFLTSQDCNANTVPDECDIASGASEDLNANSIPDDCECLADIDNDTFVTVTDLLVLLATWGTCPLVGDCFGDIDFDGTVAVPDLLRLLAAWGPCP